MAAGRKWELEREEPPTGQKAPEPLPLRVALLAGATPSSWVIANALLERFAVVDLLMEYEPQRTHAWAAIRSIGGAWRFFGQLAFRTYGQLVGKRRAARRRAEIVTGHRLNPTPWPTTRVRLVSSINHPSLLAHLKAHPPHAVVLHDAGPLDPSVRRHIEAPVLRVGPSLATSAWDAAYWYRSRVQRNSARVDVSFIDRRERQEVVLAEVAVEATPKDSYFTFPWLVLAAGMPRIVAAVEAAARGGVSGTTKELEPTDGPVMPPTLWEYWWRGIRFGLW